MSTSCGHPSTLTSVFWNDLSLLSVGSSSWIKQGSKPGRGAFRGCLVPVPRPGSKGSDRVSASAVRGLHLQAHSRVGAHPPERKAREPEGGVGLEGPLWAAVCSLSWGLETVVRGELGEDRYDPGWVSVSTWGCLMGGRSPKPGWAHTALGSTCTAPVGPSQPGRVQEARAKT